MRDDYQNAIYNNFDVQNTQGIEINAKPDDRIASNYSNKDFNWNTATHSGDIYISTPTDTHNQIVQHHDHMNELGYDGRYDLPQDGKYPGVSGFFTNEETASKHFTDDGKFAFIGLGHDLQQAPYFDDDKAEAAKELGKTYNPEYNGCLDCFRVNPEKMQENYGTTDFYAAMSFCTENSAWGDGGGFQGYNPYINEMINNGSLEYVPEKSRICNYNECTDYAVRKNQAYTEAQAVNEYIETNNIKGSHGERLGYNEISLNNDVDISTGSSKTEGISSGNIASINGGGARAPDQTAGTSPDNEVPLEKDNFSVKNNPIEQSIENDLSSQKTTSSFGIT